jgi:hypothetical protein
MKALKILTCFTKYCLGVFPPRIDFKAYMATGTIRENAWAALANVAVRMKVKKKILAPGNLRKARSAMIFFFTPKDNSLLSKETGNRHLSNVG